MLVMTLRVEEETPEFEDEYGRAHRPSPPDSRPEVRFKQLSEASENAFLSIVSHPAVKSTYETVLVGASFYVAGLVVSAIFPEIHAYVRLFEIAVFSVLWIMLGLDLVVEMYKRLFRNKK